jgi:chromosome partitioning protein
MKIVSVLNHKGGVGKTTFTGCTAQALALTGFRVLAIDNDSQHNLSTLLGVGVCEPGIRDVYTAPVDQGPRLLLRSVRTTEIANLHAITANRDLCDADVADPHHLKSIISACGLERFYDFVLIDNAPGLDRLQAASVLACHEVFVPTELKQFAINGIAEMEHILGQRLPAGGRITKIIPNFYRNTRRQNSYLSALNSLFPGRITATAIPVDAVFDELITEQKILFLHRLYSRAAAYYLKLIHELFNLDEGELWEKVKGQRQERIRADARQRYLQQLSEGEPL